MALPEVLKEFESRFQEVRVSDKLDKTVPCLWSGGIVEFSKTAPVLYSKSEHAIKGWSELATSNVPEGATILEWLQKPELMEFQITIADRFGRHRLVDNKWAVKSQFVVISNV